MTIRRRDFLTMTAAALAAPALVRLARAADTASLYDLERFGNARFARTLFEQALNAQALRLAEGADLDREALMTLSPEDVIAAARALGEQASQPKRRGFWRR